MQTTGRTFDTIIIGAGIMGLAFARELRRRDPRRTIAVFEKESDLGRHASGRNSGVLHSGIYYPEGSLKGRLCAAGAREMAEFCEEHRLPFERSGKVVLPVRESDDAVLDLLLSRGLANGARAEIIDAQQLRDLEPAARTVTGRALFTPDTAVIDPMTVLRTLRGALEREGVTFFFGAPAEVSRAGESAVRARGEAFGFGTLINAAGLQADLVARQFGAGHGYVILPFRGSYYRLAGDAGIPIRRQIYPVPDLSVPFLGVHVTRSIDGTIHLGPTAVPALGREQYHGFRGVRAGESIRIAATLARQYAIDRGFRRYVHEEARRFARPFFVAAARALVPAIRSRHLVACEKVGIRAQLFDLRKRELVMDFVVEESGRCLHVLNAVSPGFTSAFAFARHVIGGWVAAA